MTPSSAGSHRKRSDGPATVCNMITKIPEVPPSPPRNAPREGSQPQDGPLPPAGPQEVPQSDSEERRLLPQSCRPTVRDSSQCPRRLAALCQGQDDSDTLVLAQTSLACVHPPPWFGTEDTRPGSVPVLPFLVWLQTDPTGH